MAGRYGGVLLGLCIAVGVSAMAGAGEGAERAATHKGGAVTVGDASVAVVLCPGGAGWVESAWRSGSAELSGLSGALWTVEVDGQLVTPATATVTCPGPGEATAQGEVEAFAWNLR